MLFSITQEICDKVVYKKPFELIDCLDRYKTQEMLELWLGAIDINNAWHVKEI